MKRYSITYSTRGFDIFCNGRPWGSIEYQLEKTREQSAQYADLSARRMFGEQLGDVRYGPTEA